MVTFTRDRAQELKAKQDLLLKAERDIAAGWKRLPDQENLLLDLKARGYDGEQAERLLQLLKQTLVEWEQHRILIEQR